MNLDADHSVAPALVGGALGRVRHAQGVALHLTGVRFGFPTRPDFLGPVDCTVRDGEAGAIIGPNGAGKSTLLRLMAGLTQPAGGDITWMGRSLTTMSPRERASTIALLPQRAPSDLDLRVGEVVLMGRFPHRSLGLFESAEDHCIAERAMVTTQVTAFADRLIATLSGGEAQRVHLAAALAQEPRLLLLDEPTASLDLEHQLAIFSILRDRARNDGLAVVIVTHDVNLAARFCDKVLLLSDGKVVACGPPREVVTPSVLEPVYGVRLAQLRMPGGDGDWIVPSDNMAALSV